MARVLGLAGRYVSNEAERKFRDIIFIVLSGLGITAWIAGLMFGILFNKKQWPLSAVINVAALLLILAIYRWAGRRIDALAKERKELLRGERGEVSVASLLETLPDGFYVINDLKAEYGNLDSVVIGPTGVFVIDAKNWRGIVSANEKGELLLNGRFDKPHVKQLVGRVMGIRDRVKALAPELDIYIQPVLVFTSARVDAVWGATSNVPCITEDQLYDYIVERKSAKKLSKAEIAQIGRAFAALARMDPDFKENVTERPAPVSTLPQ